jgi:hypothetical protein
VTVIMFFRWHRAAIMALAAIVLSGCGASTSQVTGVVTLQNQPVGPGTVIFLPFDEEAEKQGATRALGSFAGDGKYTLTTKKDGDGAIPGKYRVIIQPQSGEGYGAEGVSAQPSKIPLRYADPQQSGLVQEVQPGENTINFDLTP